MRKTVSAFALIGAFISGQAFAEPIHRWDGFYGGANIGGTWGHADSDVSCSSSVFFACPIAAALGTPPSSFSSNTSGVIGGGQLGYNFQYVHWVFGAETDFSWTNADGSDTQNQNLLGFLPTTTTVSEKLDWLGTVRGRLGYASGDLLVYATGGLAYAKVKDSFAYNVSFIAPPPFFSATGGSSDTQTGWTVGGGAELALDKSWSLKGEYLFYDLGSQSFSAPWTFLGFAVPGTFPVETKIDGQIARVGLNYNFH